MPDQKCIQNQLLLGTELLTEQVALAVASYPVLALGLCSATISYPLLVSHLLFHVSVDNV